MTGAARYTLDGLATQKIWVHYNGTQGSDLTHHPTAVAVTAGQTKYLDLPAPQ